MLRSWPCARFWILLTLAALFSEVTRVHAQGNDPNAGSDVVGRVIAPTRPMGFVGIPPDADREAIRANVERLWSIVLRTPGLNPPKGFDLKRDLIANGILPGPREPFVHKANGLFYWYTFMPGVNAGVHRLDVAMHAFKPGDRRDVF